MKLEGEIIKCPYCDTEIDVSTVEILRSNLLNESSKEEDYFEGNDETLCRKNDNVFTKCLCKNCNKSFETMILIEVKPIKYFSAESRSDLVML